MSRSTLVLRNTSSFGVRDAAKAKAAFEETKQATAAGKEPMSADHTLYHVAPTGFWKKFRTSALLYISTHLTGDVYV